MFQQYAFILRKSIDKMTTANMVNEMNLNDSKTTIIDIMNNNNMHHRYHHGKDDDNVPMVLNVTYNTALV
jgi:hypothetical protein